jgi:aryl sulfotransferase
VSASVPVRYRSPDEDSGRWLGFPFRAGDIVISTRSKHGTTWVQMICALLVFQSPELPATLWELSPWLDWLVTPRDDVHARLSAQRHRRFIKTHTPLDGIPIDERATYVVVARHPLDAAVSLYHQGDNIDRARVRELIGGTPAPVVTARPPLADWLRSWVDADPDPAQVLDSLPGVMLHLRGAWAQRYRCNVVLVHYDDLVGNLDREMLRLASRLGIAIPMSWPDLVEAASFGRMRARADQLAPDPAGVLKDRERFFRRGSPGAAREILSSRDLDHYEERTTQLAPPELLAWLHRCEAGSSG